MAAIMPIPRGWWVQILNRKEHCWISHATVETTGLAEGLPIQTVTLKFPDAPSDFVVSSRACTGKAYALRLAWTNSPDADGYILYRNGEEIAPSKAASPLVRRALRWINTFSMNWQRSMRLDPPKGWALRITALEVWSLMIPEPPLSAGQRGVFFAICLEMGYK